LQNNKIKEIVKYNIFIVDGALSTGGIFFCAPISVNFYAAHQLCSGQAPHSQLLPLPPLNHMPPLAQVVPNAYSSSPFPSNTHISAPILSAPPIPLFPNNTGGSHPSPTLSRITQAAQLQNPSDPRKI
jgi:hypothetical protein